MHCTYLLSRQALVEFLSIIQTGDTGLMVASANDAREVVSVLLEAKADPNITDEVKLHYSHCLYNSDLIHYVTGRLECSLPCYPERTLRSDQAATKEWCSSGHQREGD